MVVELLRKEDIPGWEFGDVQVKTFSFGEKLTITDMRARADTTSPQGFKIVQEEINVKDVTITAMAYGLYTMKNKDNTELIVKPTTSVEEKRKLVFDFPFDAAQFILKKVYDLNKEITQEEKKK